MRIQLATLIIAFLVPAISTQITSAQITSAGVQPPPALPVNAPVARYDVKGGELRFIAFAHEGKEVWTMNSEGMLWRLSAKDLTVLDAGQPTGILFKLAFGFMPPNGKQIACAGWNGDACLLNTKFLDPDLLFPPHRTPRTAAVLSVHYTADGKYFATGSRDGLVRLYSLSPTKLLWQSAPMSLPVNCVKISPDSKLVAAATGDWQQSKTPGEVMVFDIQSGKVTGRSQPHTTQIIYLDFSPDSTKIASCANDGNVVVQSSDKLTALSLLPCRGSIGRIAFLDNQRLVAATEGRPMIQWDLQKSVPIQLWQGHRGPGLIPTTATIRGLAISPDGSRMATADLQGWVYLWDIASG